MSCKTIGDLLRSIDADPDFISRLEYENTQDLFKWCKNLYEAGEAMYNDSMFMDRCTSEALNAWEEARKLETDNDIQPTAQ